MTINKTRNGEELVVAVEGRLDTTSAPMLEKELKESLEGVTKLTLDLGQLNYISSAGLRVLLSTNKLLLGKGSMRVINANPVVMEVFEVTGFVDILTIE